MALFEASVSSAKGSAKFGCMRVGEDESSWSKESKAAWQSSDQVYFTDFFNKRSNGWAMDE